MSDLLINPNEPVRIITSMCPNITPGLTVEYNGKRTHIEYWQVVTYLDQASGAAQMGQVEAAHFDPIKRQIVPLPGKIMYSEPE